MYEEVTKTTTRRTFTISECANDRASTHYLWSRDDYSVYWTNNGYVFIQQQLDSGIHDIMYHVSQKLINIIRPNICNEV